MNLSKKIKAYSKMLIEDTKSDGKTKFIRCSDDASKELRHAVMEAHGDRMPADWIYRKFSEILDSLVDYDVKTIDDLQDNRSEIVDRLVDVYTSDLTAWLNESPYNVYYIDEAVKELGATENILSQAQYLAIDEIYTEVATLLENSQEE